MGDWTAVVRTAAAQGGVIAVRQAICLGVSRSSFDDRVRNERWQRPFRGVAVLPGRHVDRPTLARAAALAIGDHAIITGDSALHLHGVLDSAPMKPHVVVPEHHRPRPLRGVRLTRSRTVTEADLVADRGVWLATVPRALLDAAARASRTRLRERLIDGRQRRLLTIAEVAARAASSSGTPGRGRLLAACRDVDASGADSVLVAEVERRLRAVGFHLDVPPRCVEVPGRMLHPDLTVVGLPVAIEVDGFGTHSSRLSLDTDQRKHNAYALAGWIVLRIGWARLADDWDGFVSELRHAVATVSQRQIR